MKITSRIIQLLPMSNAGILMVNITHQLLFLICCCISVLACSPIRLYTTWTSPSTNLAQEQTTSLVLCLLDDADTFTRLSVESITARLLTDNRVHAIADWELFGLAGQKHVLSEAFLKTLYEKGFDQVIVITCIDKDKELAQSTPNTGAYPATWYYRRIMSYPNLQAVRENAGTAYWEIIVADLHLLEAVTVAHTKPYYLPYTLELSARLPQWIVDHLHHERLLNTY